MTRQGVFISHAHEDRELAEAIALLLKSSLHLDPADITCTSDAQYGLTHGESTKDDIRKRISSARALLLLLTHTSRHRDWVHYEAAVADKMPPENFRFYMMTPLDDDDDVVPAPYQGVTVLRLWHGEEVVRFIRELREHLGAPEVDPDLYIDALNAVSDRANAIRLALRQSEHQKQMAAARTNYQRLRTVAWGLAAASVVLCLGMLGAVWWTLDQRSQHVTELKAKDDQHSHDIRAAQEASDEAFRQFAFSGQIWDSRGKVRCSRVEAFVRESSTGGSERAVAKACDDAGRFTFSGPELHNDARIPLRLRMLVDGQSYEHVIRLADARLAISVER